MGLLSSSVSAQYDHGKCIELKWSDSAGVALITVIDTCINDTIWIGGVPYGGEWTFEGLNCIKVWATPPVWEDRPDTIITAIDTVFWPPGDTVIVVDTSIVVRSVKIARSHVYWEWICGGGCLAEVVIPLGCWEQQVEEFQEEVEVWKCDTTCYQDQEIMTTEKYYAWDGNAFSALRAMAFCGSTPIANGKFVRVGSKWYHDFSDGVYHRPWGSVDDSCYISVTTWTYFVFLTNQNGHSYEGMGPWLVDTSFTTTRQFEVDCDMYPAPGVTRTITDCDWVTETVTIKRVTEVWNDAGRDTTIWDDTCDCYVPKWICEEVYDTTRYVRYIYDYVYTPITEPCTRNYEIPYATSEPVYHGREWIKCVGPGDQSWAALDLIVSTYGSSSDSASSWQKMWYTKDKNEDNIYCWWCEPSVDDLMGTEVYVPTWALWDYPCLEARCEVDIDWRTITNWCCEKDTTYTFECWEYDIETGINYLMAVKQVTTTIPDMTGPCTVVDTIGWTLTDSTLVDSLEWNVITLIGTGRVLTYEDTCCHDPKINGRSLCPPIWIIRDCEPQIYWGADGNLHIPCEIMTEEESREMFVDWDTFQDNQTFIERKLDTLKQQIDAGSDWTVESKAADFTAGHRKIYLIDAAGATNIDVTLSGTGDYMEFVLKRIDDGTGGDTVTLVGENVDADVEPLLGGYESLRIMSDGTNFYYIGSYP